MSGEGAYFLVIVGGAFIGLIKGLLLSFYIGSPTGSILVCTYIILKVIEKILKSSNQQKKYLKLYNFNRKASEVTLIILIVLLIKYILYPQLFNV